MFAGSVQTGQSGHSGAYSCHTHLLLSPLLVSKLYGGQFIIIIIINIFIIITIIITIIISITIIITIIVILIFIRPKSAKKQLFLAKKR